MLQGWLSSVPHQSFYLCGCLVHSFPACLSLIQLVSHTSWLVGYLVCQVERTKNRPLASGVVSGPQVWLFLAAQLSVGLAVLVQLNWYRYDPIYNLTNRGTTLISSIQYRWYWYSPHAYPRRYRYHTHRPIGISTTPHCLMGSVGTTPHRLMYAIGTTLYRLISIIDTTPLSVHWYCRYHPMPSLTGVGATPISLWLLNNHGHTIEEFASVEFSRLKSWLSDHCGCGLLRCRCTAPSTASPLLPFVVNCDLWL